MQSRANIFLRSFALLFAILLMLPLGGCSGAKYRDDVTLDALSTSIEAQITHASHLDTADNDYLRFNFAEAAGAAAHLVRLSVSGQSLDEYGIFKAVSADDAAQLADACRTYLTRRNDAWMNTYMVEEYPKLRDAEVYVYGNYVMYLILSDAEKTAVTSAVEAALK